MMETNKQIYSMTRRQAIRLGAGALGFAALARVYPAYGADAISNATIKAVGETVSGSKYKKTGPFRIGFSNGFSGNTWRTECLFAAQKEASLHKDLAEFIVVDGQGDISKQVNDIENLVSQNVDAILCIANSGSAVAPALREATKQGVVTIPFNLPVDGEAWTAFIGTDPEKKGFALGKWLREALGDSGKIVALGGLPGNSYTASAWAGAQKAFEGRLSSALAQRWPDASACFLSTAASPHGSSLPRLCASVCRKACFPQPPRPPSICRRRPTRSALQRDSSAPLDIWVQSRRPASLAPYMAKLRAITACTAWPSLWVC